MSPARILTASSIINSIISLDKSDKGKKTEVPETLN
jgi:hypothetical protein